MAGARGLQVDGLSEAVKALGKLDKEYRREAVDIFRDVAKDVQAKAQGSIGNAGRYPNKKGMIGRSATAKGAALKLRASKYPWAYGAEYGENIASVRAGPRWRKGIPYPQSKMKRRTMGPFKPPTSQDLFKNRGGYMIQPAIRKRQHHIVREVDTRMIRLIDKAMRRAGVPNG